MSLDHMIVNGYSLTTIERQIRRRVIHRVLTEEGGHCGKAAQRLGIHRNTLTRKMQALGIGTTRKGNDDREPLE
jgi:DNA-binding NtrC family response regulator